jgi:cytochrome c553
VARQNIIGRYAESDISHVDYGSGMSEWCGNCHASYLNADHSQFEHPAGVNEQLESDMIVNYNTYIRTGDFSGDASTAFLQFVPFERGISDPLLLDPNSTFGPDSNSTVMCLTCHRAHATAFRASGRWDHDAVLLADSHPAPGDTGVAGNDVLYSYYGRDIVTEFGSGQRAFCEKCHDVNGP